MPKIYRPLSDAPGAHLKIQASYQKDLQSTFASGRGLFVVLSYVELIGDVPGERMEVSPYRPGSTFACLVVPLKRPAPKQQAQLEAFLETVADRLHAAYLRKDRQAIAAILTEYGAPAAQAA